MPNGPPDELLPLFLSEAVDRLDRLDEIFGRGLPVQGCEEWRRARRELHTLKGAGRMMGLVDLAEVCHRAEDTFDDAEEQGLENLVAAVGRIRDLIGLIRTDGVGRKVDQIEDITSGHFSGTKSVEPQHDTRVSAEILDRVSDEAVRLSFLSKGVGSMVEDLYEIARAAESGVSDRHPEQVLAALALRLRRVALKAGQARSRFDHLIDQQLGSLLSIQVRPVIPLLNSLGSHAVELGRSLGKTVEVQVDASQCRLDRRIMEALKEALLHLVRNAVDHGIETEAERVKRGKSPAGTLLLRADTLAERVRLIVSDDGRGIDPQAILSRAIERGLVSMEAAEGMSEDAVRQLIFYSGFSTRDKATAVSGRGVGLDSVAEAVRKVGGDLWIDGVPGQGLRVTLDLPVSRRGESILVVEASRFRVGIPSHQVQGFSDPNSIPPGPVREENTGEDDDAVRIDLRSHFGHGDHPSSVVIRLRAAGVPVDLVVDKVVGEEEVFLHPWPKFLAKVRGAEALALLADGTPVGVLDIHDFIRLSGSETQPVFVPINQRHALKVLLVDDSRITREMFRGILAEAGVEVLSVASGEEALAVLGVQEVDCLVTDIEMPGIDGLELTRRIRASSQWENLPVVVVSTRDQASDRMAGLEAGADEYLAKQNLMAEDLIGLVLRFGGQG